MAVPPNRDSSPLNETDQLYTDEEFRQEIDKLFNDPYINTDLIHRSPSPSPITPDPLNVAFITETETDTDNQSYVTQSQSQTTQEAKKSIHDLIETITEEEQHQTMDLCLQPTVTHHVDSSLNETNRFYTDEEFRQEIDELFNNPYINTDLIHRSPSPSPITPDPLNVAFITETETDRNNQSYITQSQSQTTQETRTSIHGLIETIVEREEHQAVDVCLPTIAAATASVPPPSTTLIETMDVSRHNRDSPFAEMDRILDDEEFCRKLDQWFNHSPDMITNVTHPSPVLSITSDPLNTAFITETQVSSGHNQSNVLQPQSQTTQEATTSIHGLIETIIEQEEHQAIDVYLPTIAPPPPPLPSTTLIGTIDLSTPIPQTIDLCTPSSSSSQTIDLRTPEISLHTNISESPLHLEPK